MELKAETSDEADVSCQQQDFRFSGSTSVEVGVERASQQIVCVTFVTLARRNSSHFSALDDFKVPKCNFLKFVWYKSCNPNKKTFLPSGALRAIL